METVSWMTDYLPVHMLAMAQQAELRFGDCLMSCPQTSDGTIRIDDPVIFTRLLECRITSLLLSMAALESYLGYYAWETAQNIERDHPGISFHDYLEQKKLPEAIKSLPNRVKRRHEQIVEEYGAKPIARFLTVARLALEEKFMYWPLIRTGKLINYKDGYVKKVMRNMALRDELLQPNIANAPELRKIKTVSEIKDVFLRHDLPASLTPGPSCAEEYVVETYAEHHFFWELLHIYPARMVPEAVQYLHMLDDSENHFIAALRAAELVDGEGNLVVEPMKKFIIEVNLEG